MLSGGNGDDTFAFGPGFGKDIINDFTHGDHVEFDGGVFANFQAVQAAMLQAGSDTVILIQDAGWNGGQHLMGRPYSMDLRERVVSASGDTR
jgi:Ca2+-binding RTX toxin-like protein